MKKILYPLLFSLAVVSTVSFANLNDGQLGTVKIQLQQINAYQENGSPAPRYTHECMKLYGQYLGKTIKNQYYINPQYSDLDSAIFDSQNVTLHPLGIAEQYSFLSTGVPAELSALGIRLISFTTGANFENSNGGIEFIDPAHSKVSCVLSGNS